MVYGVLATCIVLFFFGFSFISVLALILCHYSIACLCVSYCLRAITTLFSRMPSSVFCCSVADCFVVVLVDYVFSSVIICHLLFYLMRLVCDCDVIFSFTYAESLFVAICILTSCLS